MKEKHRHRQKNKLYKTWRHTNWETKGQDTHTHTTKRKKMHFTRRTPPKKKEFFFRFKFRAPTFILTNCLNIFLFPGILTRQQEKKKKKKRVECAGAKEGRRVGIICSFVNRYIGNALFSSSFFLSIVEQVLSSSSLRVYTVLYKYIHKNPWKHSPILPRQRDFVCTFCRHHSPHLYTQRDTTQAAAW